MKRLLLVFLLICISSLGNEVQAEYLNFQSTVYFTASGNTLSSSGLTLESFDYSTALASHPIFNDGIYFPLTDYLGNNIWVRVRHIADDPNGTSVGQNVTKTEGTPFRDGGFGGWWGFLYQFDVYQDATLTGTASNTLNGLFPSNVMVESIETLSSGEWISFESLNVESTNWGLNSINFSGSQPGSNPGFSAVNIPYSNNLSAFTSSFPIASKNIYAVDGGGSSYAEFRMSAENVSQFKYGYEYPSNGGYQGIHVYIGNPVIPRVVIDRTVGSNPSCPNSNVTFTATPIGWADLPTYQWKTNGANVGENAPDYSSSSLGYSNKISCELTSASTTATLSNSITQYVAPVLDVAISITSGSNPTCANVPVTFTASVLTNNCGYSITGYQWKLNMQNVGNNEPTFTGLIPDNAWVTCEVSTNDFISATSNYVIVSSISPTFTWYLDADLDGYYTGSPLSICSNISPGVGYTSNIIPGGDCDDSNPEINPGMSEILSNGIDDNCNGLIDETGDYCFPYSNSFSFFYINDVTLGTISNSNNGNSYPYVYSNFSALSTTVPAGDSVGYAIAAGGSYDNNQNLSIYVDFNRNGRFDDAGEQVVNNKVFSISNPATGSFAVLASQVPASYRVRIASALYISTSPCFTDYGEIEDYTIIVTPYVPPTYCVPVIDIPCTDIWLDNVTIDTLVNNNTLCNGGYSNYSSSKKDAIVPGGEVHFSLDQVSFVGATQHINMYVDYNNDLDFGDAGEQVVTDAVNVYGTPANGSFIVPANQPVGLYRMRIVTELDGNPLPSACHTISGEVEDYTLEVVPAYCTPAIDNPCQNSNFLNYVYLGGINNVSACDGYADFSSISTSHFAGDQIYYYLASSSINAQVNVYIDYNGNKSFADAEENVVINLPVPDWAGAASGFFTIPSTVVPGNYRIRITLDDIANIPDPCHVVAGEVEDYTLIVEQLPLYSTLNLNLFLEGLYTGSGAMRQAQDISAPKYSTGIADQLTVELHRDTPPYSTAYTFNNVDLHTDGSLTISTIPSGITGSYFVVIKHRNSIETWSSSAIPFGGIGSINYDFSIAASQAFGNNQKLIAGKYVIYGGDVNQDGVVDAGDLIPTDNDASNFTPGYVITDINGDGIVDPDDIFIIGNNASGFIQSKIPQ